MISYHPKAKRGYAYLYRPYNDIDVFIEDTTCRNTYEILLNRILDGKARITRVIELGGRGEVLQACQANQVHDDRRSIYIIDADFDLLLDVPAPEIDRLYRLQAFNLENLLIDEAAIIEVAVECMPNTEKASVASALNFPSFLDRAAKILVPLFYVYAAARVLNEDIETVGRSVESICAQRKRDLSLSKEKVNELKEEILANLRTHYGEECVYKTLADVKESAARRALPLRCMVSGKRYLLNLLFHMLKYKANYAGSIAQLMVRLARHCCTETDRGLRDAVLMAAKG